MLNIAILGSGLAAEIHSKALRAVAPSLPRWYASRDAGRAGAMASRFGGAGQFASYEAALASRDVDVVSVCLPPALHLEWTRRALEAGKHAIVEKPPFLDTAAFDDVAMAATRAGRQLMVAENYFYKPLTALLRNRISGGDLGDVLFIQLNAMKQQRTSGWRNDAALSGGGALFEGGIHWVSLLANIGLTPQRIRAAFPSAGGTGAVVGPSFSSGDRERALNSPERSALVTIEYAEGAVATLSYSWDLPALVNGVRMSRVYGTRGTLRFETNGVVAMLAGPRKRLFFPGLIDLAGYRAMMTDFIAAIDESRPPAYSPALARRDLHLIEEAYASSRSQHS